MSTQERVASASGHGSSEGVRSLSRAGERPAGVGSVHRAARGPRRLRPTRCPRTLPVRRFREVYCRPHN